jgi:putative membrane protein
MLSDLRKTIFAVCNSFGKLSINKKIKMNKIIRLKMTLLQTSLLAATFFIASSCNNDTQKDDSKDVAEEKNEEKFDTKNSERDAQFLVNVAEINLEQIKLGQLAQQTSKMAHVKELGKMMEASHRSVMNELTALANKKMITIPASQTDDGNDAYKKLSGKTGADFDKEYADMMVEGHEDAIDLFEKASTESTDAEIKQWATASLGGLRTHLDHAKSSQSKLKK